MSKQQLKKLIFYQDKIKDQVKKFYTKDIRTFNKEYGVFLIQEALYNAKLENLSDIYDKGDQDKFNKNFITTANEIISKFFNKKNGKILTIDKLLDLLKMQEEVKRAKQLTREEIHELYDINRIKASKLIYEAAFGTNITNSSKISMINRLKKREIERIIENNDCIDDLELTYIALKIADISSSKNKLLNIHEGNIVDFVADANLSARIEKFLSNCEIFYKKTAENNLVIDRQDKKLPIIIIDLVQSNKTHIYIESSNKSLLNHLTYTITNAIHPPALRVKIINERNYMNELKNIPIDKINLLQLVD